MGILAKTIARLLYSPCSEPTATRVGWPGNRRRGFLNIIVGYVHLRLPKSSYQIEISIHRRRNAFYTRIRDQITLPLARRSCPWKGNPGLSIPSSAPMPRHTVRTEFFRPLPLPHPTSSVRNPLPSPSRPFPPPPTTPSPKPIQNKSPHPPTPPSPPLSPSSQRHPPVPPPFPLFFPRFLSSPNRARQPQPQSQPNTKDKTKTPTHQRRRRTTGSDRLHVVEAKQGNGSNAGGRRDLSLGRMMNGLR